MHFHPVRNLLADTQWGPSRMGNMINVCGAEREIAAEGQKT